VMVSLVLYFIALSCANATSRLCCTFFRTFSSDVIFPGPQTHCS
jgi:hypothetical protein